MEHRILENILAGYWMWDFQANKVFLSKNLKASLGYGETDLDDKPETIRALINPSDLENFDLAVQAHIQDVNRKPFLVELRYYHRNGSIVWINCTGSVKEENEKGEPLSLLGCHVDITRAKEAENLLAAERELVSVFFEVNLDLLTIIDRQGRFAKISSQWENMLGFEKEEILNQKFDFFIHPADLAITEEALTSVWSTGELPHFINRYRCKDGSYRSIEWRAIAKGDLIYASARDITARIKAMNDILQLQNINTSIIESTSEGIMLQDSRGNIIQCNNSAERILGLRYDQMVGKKMIDPQWKIICENGSELDHPAMLVIKDNKPVFNQIIGVQKPTKETTWVLVNSVPILASDNLSVDSTVTSLTDITELKQKEAKLQHTFLTVFDQKNKLENFAHIVSHNLRSHAHNIAACVQLLKEAEDENERTEVLSYVEMASNQFTQTIVDLNYIVDSSKRTELGKINLYQFFNKTISSISTDLQQKSVELHVNIPEELNIEYRPAYLESIILNLVTNGIKYRHPDRFPILRIRAYNKGGNTFLEIEDNGLGIDMDKYGKKLFGMYTTFHGNKDAKGIGLYITKNQIEEMRGTIDVKSRVNVGTQFTIRLNPVA